MSLGNGVKRAWSGPLRIGPARLGALLGAGAALSTLAGWILDAPALRSLVHGWPAATPLCALALLMCSASLVAHTTNGALARAVALTSALLATLIALLICLEQITGGLGLDRLILAGKLAQAHQPAHPSPWTGIALLGCGASLLAPLGWTRTGRVLRVLSVLALAVGICGSLIGFSWPAGDHSERVGVLLGLGLLATIVGGTRPLRAARARWWLTTPIVLTLCLVVITAAAAVAANDQASRDAVMKRATIATRLRGETLNAVDATIARLQDVAASVTDHWPAHQSDFTEIAGGLLSQQALGGVGLIEFVLGPQRSSFEHHYHHLILMISASGVKQRDPRRADYFVTRSSVHRPDQSSNTWVDIGTDPKRRATLIAAARTDAPQATRPIELFASDRAATALYVPIYRPGMALGSASQRLTALRGFIGGSYRYDLLGVALRSALPAGVTFSVDDGNSVLFNRGHPTNAEVSTVAVAGRLWTLTIGAPPADHSLLTTVLLVGGILTFLLGALSLQAARRERYALALVGRRLAEREQAERALEAAEKRFRTAFSEAPIGMALIQPDGHLLQVNRALSQISGHSEPRLLKMRYEDLTHPEDRSADTIAMSSLASGEIAVHDVEKRILHAAGHVVWVAVHSTLVRDDQDEPSYLLAQIEDITTRRRYELRLQHMADHDPLTGLFNRRAFERLLEAHIVRGERYGHEGALIMLDLDEFKQVNDTLGHSAGDKLIVRVANALSARLRDSDTIARLGGDEFAILLPTGDKSEAEQLAQALLETIRQERAARGPGGRARPISASIGVATLAGTAELSADEILINADLAMYDAKEAGRDRAETYGNSTHGRARIETRLEWVERIRSALEEEHLVLYAQPVVQTQTGRVTQYELLVRMIDDQGEVIGPASFLPIAERFGLIKDIDHWVVRRAIAILGEHNHRGIRSTVEINLSGQSLGDRALASMISERLAYESVDPTQLIFEVTETTAISNIGAAQSFASQLAELGCRFALDDFGAGFGSFYYLKHLPFDFIKIDGEFVRNCTTNATDRLVIRAVVDLARGMDKRTIAEFVGDEQTLTALAELGVDYAQGYYLGKPAPVAEVLGCLDPQFSPQTSDRG